MEVEKMIGQIVIIQPDIVVYVIDKIRRVVTGGPTIEVVDTYMCVDCAACFHIVEPDELIRLAIPNEVSAIKKSLDAINFFI